MLLRWIAAVFSVALVAGDGVAHFSVIGLPTVTEPLRVRVWGRSFSLEDRITLMHTRGVCNESATTSYEPSGVSTVHWTRFDGKRWEVVFYPPSAGGWAGFPSWGTAGRLWVCLTGENVQTVGGAGSFAVLSADVSYTLHPPTVVYPSPIVLVLR
eukprot:Hpha_TRINITY_DN16574_c0_g12::TRINITY_DN16574_c0_g12_i1::g.136477::m.136477